MIKGYPTLFYALLSEHAGKHQEAIINIRQRLHDKGRQESLQQGIEQVIEQERLCTYQRQLEIARNLLKKGVSLELIMESPSLSREELILLQ